MRLYLTGFMGSGKTTVGRLLAEATGRDFVDLDVLLERRAGRTIPEIFAAEGERWFRKLEHEVLCSVLQPRIVVATGGGTAVYDGNRRWMNRHGVVIWIRPTLATILDRIGALGKRTRPLFETEEQVYALYRSRLPAYSKADLVIDVGVDETPPEVAARLQLLISEGTCGT